MMSSSLEFHTLQLCILKGLTLYISSSEDDKGHRILHGSPGSSFSNTVQWTATKDDDDLLKVESASNGCLTIQHKKIGATDHRYDLKWTLYKPKELRDVFSMNDAHWYGSAQVRKQKWPLEQVEMKLRPFVAGNSFLDSDFGGVQERYFLSSNGVAMFVDAESPLFVAINPVNYQLTFAFKYEWPYQNHTGKALTVSYSIFQGENLKTVHDLVSREMIPKPMNIPDMALFCHPIWSTWALYKKDINQEIILQFADEIVRRGFRAAQLEIDDDWTPAYGDHDFDKKKFPNPRQMMEKLAEKGLRVTLWVHPFASPRSEASGQGNFWVSSTLKGYTTWWNGIGKSLDVTNPAAVAWFKGCLQVLVERYGIASFKFDAGEVHWLPRGYSTHMKMDNPNNYSKLYAEMCYDIDKELRAQEVRIGIHTQHLPVLVRMMDKDSNWGYDNGLKTLIPHALTFGIIGYPFLLPDMVGGNAYQALPDRELYIRWMEANALLPSIQISIPPWQYDDEVVEISHKMLSLHETYSQLIIRLAKEATLTGAPIIRPLWWIAPNDETAQTIDSEFLVGDDLLVAPVLEPQKTSRSIYLPTENKWKCEITGDVLQGGQWYNDYPAKLDHLPHFTRILRIM